MGSTKLDLGAYAEGEWELTQVIKLKKKSDVEAVVKVNSLFV